MTIKMSVIELGFLTYRRKPSSIFRQCGTVYPTFNYYIDNGRLKQRTLWCVNVLGVMRSLDVTNNARTSDVITGYYGFLRNTHLFP